MSQSVVMALVFVISFLLGSIPFGLVIGKLAFHKDIRAEGSGNIGTTNAMRTMGKAGGIAVFLLDFGKGILSAVIALNMANLVTPPNGDATQLALALAFAGSIAGHVYSPWLGFHGGKGIAVAVGAMFIAFGWQVALIEIALFAILVVTTRYVSVGSIAAALLCPIMALIVFWGNWMAVLVAVYAAMQVLFAHHENMDRLANGVENRIGGSK